MTLHTLIVFFSGNLRGISKWCLQGMMGEDQRFYTNDFNSGPQRNISKRPCAIFPSADSMSLLLNKVFVPDRNNWLC